MFEALAGLAIGAIGVWGFYRLKAGGFRKLAEEILSQAEAEARRESEKGERERAEKAHAIHEKRREGEIKLARQEERLRAAQERLAEERAGLERQTERLSEREAKMSGLEGELERVAGMCREEAQEQLLTRVESELAGKIQRAEAEAKQEADRLAGKILSTAINRLAVPAVTELTVTTVSLPSDEMKGRIIGREGRNVRVLESLTGCNLVVDDTPGAVVISGFDPIRKHIAKSALTDLVLDGRIHPTRIEEAVEKAREQVDQEIFAAGEAAALKMGVHGLHQELLILLGKLKFRHSFGQNVLEHSQEVSALLGMMAAELGLDEALGRRIGLLHDIGKAVSHEMKGTHTLIGYELAKKYGESEAVANGIGCHHDEMEPCTVEGSLCSAADALSGARPGARAEALDQYVSRVKRLEEIAAGFEGVTQAYALQAGRELRVVVEPGAVKEASLPSLARKVATKIQERLTYPGRIRVVVMREQRIIEYAS